MKYDPCQTFKKATLNLQNTLFISNFFLQNEGNIIAFQNEFNRVSIS